MHPPWVASVKTPLSSRDGNNNNNNHWPSSTPPGSNRDKMYEWIGLTIPWDIIRPRPKIACFYLFHARFFLKVAIIWWRKSKINKENEKRRSSGSWVNNSNFHPELWLLILRRGIKDIILHCSTLRETQQNKQIVWRHALKKNMDVHVSLNVDTRDERWNQIKGSGFSLFFSLSSFLFSSLTRIEWRS